METLYLDFCPIIREILFSYKYWAREMLATFGSTLMERQFPIMIYYCTICPRSLYYISKKSLLYAQEVCIIYYMSKKDSVGVVFTLCLRSLVKTKNREDIVPLFSYAVLLAKKVTQKNCQHEWTIWRRKKLILITISNTKGKHV